MTPNTQIIIPLLDKTLSTKEDWEVIKEYAEIQLQPDVKKESLIDYYTEKLLKDHFKKESLARSTNTNKA